MKYTHLLFDLDNTLLDFNQSSKLAFFAAMHQLEVHPTEDFYKRYKKINAAVWKQLEDGIIAQAIVPNLRFQLFLESENIVADPAEVNAQYLAQLVEHTLLIDGAMELVKEWATRFKMAIATNGLKIVQRPRIERASLTPFFETIVVSDEIGCSKPSKEYFEYTFQQLGMPEKNKVLMIGDSLNSDIRGANEYGIDSCWYNPSVDKNSSDVVPTFEISKLENLNALVYENK